MPLLNLPQSEALDGDEASTIAAAFDAAWLVLQARGSQLGDPAKSPLTRIILAKRIIAMTMDGMADVTKLRDDALAHLHKRSPTR
jgi:hypothetical protein